MSAVLPYSEHPPSTDPNFFQTVSLSLSAALIAAQQLKFSHCELHANCKDAMFFFEDPHHIGSELQRKYTSGILPTVHAKVLNEARSYLMEEANRLKGTDRAKK
jgi:hypothetical protein